MIKNVPEEKGEEKKTGDQTLEKNFE